MTKWAGKVVAVTGGSAGLGLHIARSFAADGAEVAILGRDQERLSAVAGDAAQTRLHPFVADLLDADQTGSAVASIMNELGRLDVWINNVGASMRGQALTTSPAQFRESLETNLISAVHGSQAAAPHIQAAKGSLVFIGSLASKTASPHLGAYPVSKFAVAAYAHQLRLELKSQGVHVMLVCPGPIRRDDAGQRYDSQSNDLPDSARQPGGGVTIRGLDPDLIATKIKRGCERRVSEIVMPMKARLLFALAQLSPSWGDWLLSKVAR